MCYRCINDGEERWVHSTSAETMIASGGLLLVHTCSPTEETET